MLRCKKCNAFILECYSYCPDCGTKIDKTKTKVKVKCPHCNGNGYIEFDSLFDPKFEQYISQTEKEQ